jgi:hypothetical protein
VDTEAEVFCASYTNFYIANGAIIMPAYGIEADEAAALAQAFPGREVVPVRINHLAHGGGGALHHPAATGLASGGLNDEPSDHRHHPDAVHWDLPRNLDRAEQLVRQAAAMARR